MVQVPSTGSGDQTGNPVFFSVRMVQLDSVYRKDLNYPPTAVGGIVLCDAKYLTEMPTRQ